jgi:SAM-dependent methyltransferase
MLYGVLGRLLGWSRDVFYRRIHAVARRGMEIAPTDNILELQFGTGGLIRIFAAAAPQGFIAGVDPSQMMWEIARRRNDAAIREGRVDLRVCEPTLLPWQEGRFDKYSSSGGSARALEALNQSGFEHGAVVGRVGPYEILIAIRAAR